MSRWSVARHALSLWIGLSLSGLASQGCDDEGDPQPGHQDRGFDGAADAASTLLDASSPDAAPPADQHTNGALADALPRDSQPLDLEPPDSSPADARLRDAEPVRDTQAADGDLDAEPDAEVVDAQAPDAGPLDASAAAAALGLTEAEQAWIAALSAPMVPAPDPTNRVADDPAAARLGQAVFFGQELGPGIINCTFCHVSATAFSHQLTYDGLGGLHNRSVPALVNSAVQTWFFWDGRKDSAWSQAATPFEDPDEMASDRLFIAHAIAGDANLRSAYEAVFGDLPPLDQSDRFPPRATPRANAAPELRAAWDTMAPDDQHAASEVLANVGKALAAFERRLIRADSAFDRFARGLRTGDAEDLASLSQAALRGLRLFIGEARCVNCHNTPSFSDGQFHNLGQRPFNSDRAPRGRAGAIAELLADEFNAAGVFSDDPAGPRAQRLEALAMQSDAELTASEGAFRTPTLRNVARTLPYGHDGRWRSLEQMVRYKMAPSAEPPGVRDPLLNPIDLSEEDIAALVAFLTALTSSELPEDLLGPPANFP